MWKAIGATLVLAGSLFVGVYSSVLHNRELWFLQRLVAVMDHMTCELQYRLTPLPSLCRVAAKEGKGEIGQIFLDLADELDGQVSPDVNSCMICVLNKRKCIPSIGHDALRQLGNALGRFDLPGQLKTMEAVRRYCRTQIENLTDRKDDRLQAYKTLGLCAGAALVILLI